MRQRKDLKNIYLTILNHMGQGKKERTKLRQQKKMDTQKAKEEELRLQQQQDIEMIISQADSSLTTEQATELYQKYECDVVKTLTHLWDPVKAEEPLPGVQVIDRENIPEDATVLDETGQVVSSGGDGGSGSGERESGGNGREGGEVGGAGEVAEDIEDETPEMRREKGVEQISRLRTIADQKDTIFTQFQEDYKKKNGPPPSHE